MFIRGLLVLDMDEFNSFIVAIKATNKEIALKEKKMKSVTDDWELCTNPIAANDLVLKLAHEVGKNEGLLSWGERSEKAEAKKAIPRLLREIKRVRNLNGLKIMDLQFQLKDELEILNTELRVLNSLSSRNPRHIMF